MNEYHSSLNALGSVLWAFEKSVKNEWTPKHLIPIKKQEDKENLQKLLEELKEHDDVQDVITNANF